jgi:hypothetical protein
MILSREFRNKMIKMEKQMMTLTKKQNSKRNKEKIPKRRKSGLLNKNLVQLDISLRIKLCNMTI